MNFIQYWALIKIGLSSFESDLSFNGRSISPSDFELDIAMGFVGPNRQSSLFGDAHLGELICKK